jgi:hypothetical protein
MVAVCGFAHAALTPASGYLPYYTHTNSDAIVSYDWDASGNLYYQTATPAYGFGGFFMYDGATTTTIAPGNSNFPGASVLTIGDYVYYNDSDFTNQYIRKYGPLSGTPSVSQTSTTLNYSLHEYAGDLLISGGTFTNTYLYHTTLDASGDLVPDPATNLGEMNGNSGPAATDAAGNLYYAPGFSDLTIYRWTAAEVAAAIADPVTNPLDPTGHEWLDYSSMYVTVSGATSMLVDGDSLLLTLSDFLNPSVLVGFDIAGGGGYAGTYAELLQDTGRIGELRLRDGRVFVSSDNGIVFIPEPATLAFLALSGLAVLNRRRPRN